MGCQKAQRSTHESPYREAVHTGRNAATQQRSRPCTAEGGEVGDVVLENCSGEGGTAKHVSSQTQSFVELRWAGRGAAAGPQSDGDVLAVPDD